MLKRASSTPAAEMSGASCARRAAAVKRWSSPPAIASKFMLSRKGPSKARRSCKAFPEVTHEEHCASFYRYEGDECVQHLFRVACGLDSMVVGETEVLGQAKQAYEAARNSGGAG